MGGNPASLVTRDLPLFARNIFSSQPNSLAAEIYVSVVQVNYELLFDLVDTTNCTSH
jgi:hypothetical protein